MEGKLLQKKKSYCYFIREAQLNNVSPRIDFIIENFDKQKHQSIKKMRNERVFDDFVVISDSQDIIVACLNGDVIGHLCLKPMGDKSQGRIWQHKYYIHYGYVSPNYRGNNIYPAMLNEMCRRFFRQFSNSELYISTGEKNIAAQNSFNKIGFVKYAELYEIYFHGHRLFSYTLNK